MALSTYSHNVRPCFTANACILVQTHVSGLDIRTARRHKASIKHAQDCWSNSRVLCEKFSAHTSEARRAAVLSLATPLATLLKTVFVPFFLTINAFIKTRNWCIFLHPNQTGDFSGACFSFASAPGVSQMSVEKVHHPNELRQNNEMLLGCISVKQTLLSCQPSLCSRRML